MKIVILTLHLVAAGPAAAVEPFSQNPNWSAWLGCWQAQGAPANEQVCVTPSDNGVRIATMIDGSVRDESRVIADGAKRPVQSVGCTGSERAYWSNDRRRVFLESDVACGVSGRRTLRGLFAFVAPDEWISVQTATEGDSVATRVVRFTAVDSRSVPAGANSFAPRTGFAESLLTVDETAVNEAVAHIGGEGVQEWMRLAGEPFQLGYQGQDRGNGSALEQVGRMSNPVVVREVVRVVERPVYVHDAYYDDYYYHNYYRWHYSPWGYHYSSWYWHRPVFIVHLPLYIHRNSHYRHDYWRHDRDRFDHDDRDNRNRGGRVTRGGYSSGRERAVPVSSEPNRARTQPQASEQRVTRSAAPREATRESSRRGSESAAPSRSSGSNSSRGSSSRGTSGSRPAVSRTARAR
jgi:hypothetical protein